VREAVVVAVVGRRGQKNHMVGLGRQFFRELVALGLFGFISAR